jgi:hypothetical protein
MLYVNLRRSMLRRESRLPALIGLALVAGSAVILWRTPSLEEVGAVAPGLPEAEKVAAAERSGPARGVSTSEDGAAQAVLTQEMLRRVDHAAAAAGVRVVSINVHSAPSATERAAQTRLQLDFSGAGPYRAIKNLLERVLQSDSSLALDRVSLSRSSESTGELDVQVELHRVAWQTQ